MRLRVLRSVDTTTGTQVRDFNKVTPAFIIMERDDPPLLPYAAHLEAPQPRQPGWVDVPAAAAGAGDGW